MSESAKRTNGGEDNDSIDYYTVALAGVSTFLVGYAIKWFFSKSRESSEDEKKEAEPRDLRSEFRRYPLGEITLDELSQMDGSDGRKLMLSICGRVFDLSAGTTWYGPKGPYQVFAGCDATYMFGCMNLKEENRNKRDFGKWHSDWSGHGYCIDEFEEDTLADWINKFLPKYPIVALLKGYTEVAENYWLNLVRPHFRKGSEHLSQRGMAKDPHIKNTPEIELTLNSINRSTHISVGGRVFDISIVGYLYEPMYGDFPGAIGHDISVALVTDDFTLLDEAVTAHLHTAADRQRLKELIALYSDTYPTVGHLKNAAEFRFEDDGSWYKGDTTVAAATTTLSDDY